MKLNKKTDYAIRILIYLNKHQQNTIISQISTDLNLSFEYSRKIIQELSKLGYVNATKGINGGVKLATDASDKMLKDLIIYFENIEIDEQSLTDCSTCPYKENCKFQNLLNQAQLNFLKTFDNISIKDLG